MEGGAEVMTEEQQRIAIAEACGWKFIPVCCDGEFSPPQFTTVTPEGRHLCGYYPDYPNDLNAMHEAEMSLKQDDPHAYGCYCDHLYEEHGNPVSLTARVRAKTFLETIGKWEEARK
jgi:hypothetical protein